MAVGNRLRAPANPAGGTPEEIQIRTVGDSGVEWNRATTSNLPGGWVMTMAGLLASRTRGGRPSLSAQVL